MRVTHLMNALPLVEISRCCDVHDEPALFESEVFHAGSDPAARDAVGSVASENVVGFYCVFAAVGAVGVGDADPVRAPVAEVGDLDVASQLRAWVVLEVSAQKLFELGLVEHVGLRKTVAAQSGSAAEFCEHLHGTVEQPKSACGAGNLGEPLGDTQAGDDPEDLVVQVHGARLRVHLCPSVQKQAVDAVLRQQGSHGDAGRARPEDDDGNMRDAHAYLTAVRWVPRSIAASSVPTVASTKSPCFRYLSFFDWLLKNAFHFNAGGRSAPMISMGLGGALSAVPTGVR